MRKDVESLEYSLKTKYKNLDTLMLSYDNNRNSIIIHMIKVHSKKEGTGSYVMRDLTTFADNNGMNIWLDPAQRDDHHGTTSRSRLVKFYKRFGFVENKGRNKDFSWRGGMYRTPTRKSFKEWVNHDN